MIRRVALISTALMVLAHPVIGQEAAFDPSARAKIAGEAAAIGAGSSVFSYETVEEHVVPYQGTNTPETSLDSGNMEGRANEVISGSSEAARAYRGSMDSVTLRPKYDLDPDHLGVTVGDRSTINAEDIAGRYFTSTTEADPACNFTDFNVLEPFERFCDVHSNIRAKTCTIDRIVDVDRRDTWRCDVTAEDITITCTPNQDGVCAVQDLPEGNPDNQCTFSEERCVAWGHGMTREPSTGANAIAAASSITFGWVDAAETYTLMWDGAEITSGLKQNVVPHTDTEGWTYYLDTSTVTHGSVGLAYGVYREKVSLAVVEEGPFYGWENGGGYGAWVNPYNPVYFMWNGELLTRHGHQGMKIGECTYYHGEPQQSWPDFSWAPVFGSSVPRMFWRPVRRTCERPTICTEMERDYSCSNRDQCASLAATAACEQVDQDCLTTGPNGCELDRSTYSCFNDLSNHAPALLLESKIERIEDRLVSACDPSPAEQGCIAGESVCIGGEEVRTVTGFPVSRDCWQYSQSFSCLAEGVDSYTDCSPFQHDPSCKVIGQTCLSFVESEETVGTLPAECQHWEYQYRCGGNIELPEQCTAFNVCVGGLCEGIVDEPNTDFANAAAWLTVLDEAAEDNEKNIDAQNVTLFSGTGRNCKVGAVSYLNCCRDSGWANGIIGDCSEDELALIDRIQAKAAVYIGTYCTRKVLGVCLSKRRSYCTFNSQLGMVFQKEIRRISGRGWGSAENPNCAGLPLNQIETIDWDQIDLSEAFVDMVNGAAVPTTGMVTDYLRDRLDLTAGAVSQGD